MTSSFVGIVATPDPIRSIDSATFTGSYQAVGSALTRPIRLVKFVNNSTVLVTVSWDGVNAHDVLPATTFSLYDVTTNRVALTADGQYAIAVGTQFYVKGSAGTGLFYIICIGS